MYENMAVRNEKGRRRRSKEKKKTRAESMRFMCGTFIRLNERGVFFLFFFHFVVFFQLFYLSVCLYSSIHSANAYLSIDFNRNETNKKPMRF